MFKLHLANQNICSGTALCVGEALGALFFPWKNRFALNRSCNLFIFKLTHFRYGFRYKELALLWHDACQLGFGVCFFKSEVACRMPVCLSREGLGWDKRVVVMLWGGSAEKEDAISGTTLSALSKTQACEVSVNVPLKTVGRMTSSLNCCYLTLLLLGKLRFKLFLLLLLCFSLSYAPSCFIYNTVLYTSDM